MSAADSSPRVEELRLRDMNRSARRRLLDRTVCLVGFMGAGKTSLGRALGSALERPFYDADDYIEETFQRPIPDYFAAGEEAVFRRIESETVHNLLDRPPCVLALGGGTLDDPTTRAHVYARSFAVHLVVSWQAVRREAEQLGGGRPMMDGRSEAEVHELFLRRQQTYRGAHLRIAPPRGDVDAAAHHVIRCLEQLRG